MSFATLLSTYGYPAIVIGTFLEGETILVLAGFAAHGGYLELPWVVTCGFLGTLCGDQLYFYLGRTRGTKFLEKRPRWKVRSQGVLDLLQSHQVLLITGFRFLYGLRTITPFLLGATGIPISRFLIFNTLGGLLWAISVGVSGYLFGHVLELLIGDIKRYEIALFVVLTAIGAVVWGVHGFRTHKSARQTDEPET